MLRDKDPDRNGNGRVSRELLRDLTTVFGLLSDETRLKIVLLLSRYGTLNVTQICQHVEQTQPAVSRHLGLMRLAGLVTVEQRGKFSYYSVDYGVFRRLMQALQPEGHYKNCDCFLECVLKGSDEEA